MRNDGLAPRLNGLLRFLNRLFNVSSRGKSNSRSHERAKAKTHQGNH